jgi:formylglycine-generating enzyme required for sulfatase activity
MIIIKTRLAILTLLVAVIVISISLFYSNNTTQQLDPVYVSQNEPKLRLQTSNAPWETYFFKELEKYTKEVGLPSLRTVRLPGNDLEMRFWFDSLLGKRGLILQRSSRKWSAIYLHEVYDNQISSVKVENLEQPKSGWDNVWKSLVEEGILTLPDSYSNEECSNRVIDGQSYVVETNVNCEYRTFAYGNPEYAECDEARHLVLMVKIILGEFELSRFSPGLPSTLVTEDIYWKKLDKTNLQQLKAYLAKYPKGSYVYPAKVAIRNVETAKLTKIVSNTKKNNPLSNSTGIMQSDIELKEKKAGEFILIPAGNFIMGSDEGYFDERPAHKVIISESFEIGKYEVTQEQWELVMGDNPSYFKGNKHLPIESVSWNDVQRFINKLNSKSAKYIYRLPTEAEWEYAARAGSKGDSVANLDTMAWYRSNSGDKPLKTPDFGKTEGNLSRTHPVGKKKPNAWGLYDMYGNVWEWCSDWYGGYSSETVTDPRGTTIKSRHVNRGCDFYSLYNDCGPAIRNQGYMPSGSKLVGFRLVRIVRSIP